jgi:hypothetical protein
MATQLTQQFIYQFSDADGLLVGGKVHFYDVGTTDDRPIYASATETVNNELANPIVLDDLGSFGTTVVFLSGNYNIVITDRDNVEKWSRDNLNATSTSAAVEAWILDAQSARAVLGGWTVVKAEAGVTIASGDVILGDTNRNSYKLNSGGDSNLNPESDNYDENTGVGAEWTNLTIANAPIHQDDLDLLQDEIDANTANIATPFGMEFSNNSLDSANDIDFTAGVRRDSTQAVNITTVALVKATDAAFGLGTGQGGMPAGLLPKAADYYRLFAIRNTVTEVTDIGFDTSSTAINLLAAADLISTGFTQFVQIGWIAADSASTYDLFQFKANKGRFVYNQKIEARADGAALNGAESITMSSPPDANVDVLFTGYVKPNANNTFDGYVLFYDLSNSPTTTDATTCDLVASRTQDHTQSPGAGNFERRTNASGQIGVNCSATGAFDGTDIDLAMSTIGFIYDRGIG